MKSEQSQLRETGGGRRDSIGEQWKPSSNRFAVPACICHNYVVCSNSWQFRSWIFSLLSEHTQHLDALCADCLTFTAAPPQQSLQPGVQSAQAPAALLSHSSMQQPNAFTPSLKPPPLPMPANSDGGEQERTRECAHKGCSTAKCLKHSSTLKCEEAGAAIGCPMASTVLPHCPSS